MKKISCIIPAHNEEAGIEQTLKVLSGLIGKNIFEVIVVDDASVDATKEIIKKFPNVRLVEHDINKGKSKSVADGIIVSSGEYVFLLDADLKFLSEKNIFDLIDPIENEKADVSMSYIKNAWPLFPFKKIDYLSGQRILPKDKVINMLEDMGKLPSYGLEVFLNRIIIKNKMRLAVVHWSEVENIFNQEKYGLIKGLQIVLKVWMNVISTVGILGMYYQNIKMRNLLI
ncbi:MAG: glycosyltransferase [Candidatus Nomurabacteria bacterium]